MRGVLAMLTVGLAGVAAWGQAPAGEVPWELREAGAAIKRLYQQRLADTVTEMADIRGQLKGALEQEVKELRTREAGSGKVMVDVDAAAMELVAANIRGEMSLDEQYRLCAQLEVESARLYQGIRVCRLARERDMPLSQAASKVSLNLPARRKADEKALAALDAPTPQGFAAAKRELVDLYLESQEMINATRSLAELAAKSQQVAARAAPEPGPASAPAQRPTLDVSKVELVLGNKLIEGMKAQYMVVDRWYWTGPFGHPGRERRLPDLERRYPPEGTADLDAVYHGKDGRRITWKYERVGPESPGGGLKFRPPAESLEPWSVYYFFTEVHSDRALTVAANFASDDYGVCWLNRERVYQSPPTANVCVPFERYGWRVLRLRKGLNQFLFKLENAGGDAAFSVVLMTRTDQETIDSLRGD